MHKYSTEQKGNATIVTVDYTGPFEADFLLAADRHWDNTKSDQALQKKHLDQAVERKAGVFDFGDLFCAMQGRDDKRSSKSSLRVEHKENDYYDRLADTAAEWFKPYANSFIMMSPGNHESAVLKHHETDLTGRLICQLNDARTSGHIHYGGFSGWVMFQFRTKKQITFRSKLWYIHGYGGGGPVTRGVIQTNRQAVYVPDASIVVNGHTHDEWSVPIARTRLTDDGNIWRDEQWHVRVPSYKDEYGDGRGGWHIERGGPPKTIGAAWLTFRQRKGEPIETLLTRAK